MSYDAGVGGRVQRVRREAEELALMGESWA